MRLFRVESEVRHSFSKLSRPGPGERARWEGENAGETREARVGPREAALGKNRGARRVEGSLPSEEATLLSRDLAERRRER